MYISFWVKMPTHRNRRNNLKISVEPEKTWKNKSNPKIKQQSWSYLSYRFQKKVTKVPKQFNEERKSLINYAGKLDIHMETKEL